MKNRLKHKDSLSGGTKPSRFFRDKSRAPKKGRWRVLGLLGLLGMSEGVDALTSTEWAYRQPFTINAPGATKVALPLETLDNLQPDLRDLRILDPDTNETPYVLIRPRSLPPRLLAAVHFHAELSESATVLSFGTGTNESLQSIELITAAREFLKPVRIEISDDERTWEKLAEGVTIFRQDGVEQTHLSLEGRKAAYVRLTVQDAHTPPLAFTSVRVLSQGGEFAPGDRLPVRVVRTEQFAGETVVTLDLGAAHLDLASLELSALDPLLTRNASVAIRELKEGEITERVIGQATVFRVALEGLPPAAQLEIPLESTVPNREIILHLENGDSAPLQLGPVVAHRRPVYAVFATAKSGAYSFLSGNAGAPAARYDLAALASQLKSVPVTDALVSALVANANYHEANPLAGIAFEGAPLDPASWRFRRAVSFSSAGVLELELDPPVLASALPDLADLRLLRAGKQVPYILERSSLTRALELSLIPEADPRQRSISRWKISLGRAGLPLGRLTVNTPAPLFERQFRLYEKMGDARGEESDRPLAASHWTRRLGEPTRVLTLAFSERPQTETLWLETDNGDNPPLTLERAQAYYPVTRVLFKAAPSESLALLYGNAEAAAPRYDLGLVAHHLLAAEKTAATLAAEEKTTGAGAVKFLNFTSGGILFWAVLALVVVVLLAVVAKLLPKPPTDENSGPRH